ncbi:MAG: hypothetical protein AAFU60_16645, partial [Bacteroidota bacterium]
MNSLSTFKNTVLFALMCGIAGIFSCESTNSADSKKDSEPEKSVDQWQIEPVFGHWLDSQQRFSRNHWCDTYDYPNRRSKSLRRVVGNPTNA